MNTNEADFSMPERLEGQDSPVSDLPDFASIAREAYAPGASADVPARDLSLRLPRINVPAIELFDSADSAGDLTHLFAQPESQSESSRALSQVVAAADSSPPIAVSLGKNLQGLAHVMENFVEDRIDEPREELAEARRRGNLGRAYEKQQEVDKWNAINDVALSVRSLGEEIQAQGSSQATARGGDSTLNLDHKVAEVERAIEKLSLIADRNPAIAISMGKNVNGLAHVMEEYVEKRIDEPREELAEARRRGNLGRAYEKQLEVDKWNSIYALARSLRQVGNGTRQNGSDDINHFIGR